MSDTNRRGFLAAVGGLLSAATIAPMASQGYVVPKASLTGEGLLVESNGQKIVLEIDGRAIAEAVVPHISSIVRRHGLV